MSRANLAKDRALRDSKASWSERQAQIQAQFAETCNPSRVTPEVLPPPPWPICGARFYCSRCERRDLCPNGLCPAHGGLSTGPKTPEGRRQSAINGRKGGRPRKATGGTPPMPTEQPKSEPVILQQTRPYAAPQAERRTEGVWSSEPDAALEPPTFVDGS